MFNIKATFLLGDFVTYLNSDIRYDLIFASGVLYHMVDPGEFLVTCARCCEHLFIWTMIITPEIWSHEYESLWIERDESSERTILGLTVTYYKHYYEQAIVDSAKYAGAIAPYSHWMTYGDIEKIINAVGFKIVGTVPDEAGGIKAMNILCSRT